MDWGSIIIGSAIACVSLMVFGAAASLFLQGIPLYMMTIGVIGMLVIVPFALIYMWWCLKV